MGNFFYKIFIKDFENTSEPSVRLSYGKFASYVGILLNLILTTSKIFFGILSNSISIIADGINNLADASSSIITLLGFKLSAKPSDEKHPYGHGRIEYITGLIISVFIIFIGFNLAQSSFNRLFHKEDMNISIITIIILIISIFIKVIQSAINISIGKKIDSKTLIATAIDSRNDIISTLSVLISSGIFYFYEFSIDGYIGLLVSAFIIYSGISLTIEMSSPLIGELPSDDIVKNIEDLVLSHKEIIGIHDLIVHNYGVGKIFASLHIEVDASKDIMQSHELVDHIEADMSSKLNINFVAHMDPVEINNPILNEVKPLLDGYVNNIEGLSQVHDMRCIKGSKRINIIFDIVRDENCILDEDTIKTQINQLIKSKNKSYNAIITFDKAYTNIKN